MSELSDLPNVGKVLEQYLIEVGITTPEQLREIGVKEAFLRIRVKDPEACVHMLYGIQGAVEGIMDKYLSEKTKQELKEFHRNL
jgi:DNA transformation protein